MNSLKNVFYFIGKPRKCEVKLKCKPDDPVSKVTIYLMEPKKCEYVLGVESPLVCDILHLADEETGLLPEIRDEFFERSEDGRPSFWRWESILYSCNNRFCFLKKALSRNPLLHCV